MDINVPYKNVDSRAIKIKLIDGTQLNGQINLNRAPRYSRLSDLVASDKEPFLVVFAATSYQVDSDTSTKHETLFVNKDHIIWAEPDEIQD
ncbi:MAG: hypothetical protein K8S18_09470 [Desulfobacula sp.]|nr:hypothetical protein [Desulfobacula sp.]MCK5165409.1 hypothetical protein [Desulfobacula sp.]